MVTSTDPSAHPNPLTLAKRLEQLVDKGNLLTREVSLDSVLQHVTDLARTVIGARYAAFGRFGPDGKTLEAFHSSGVTDQERSRIGPIPQGVGILGLVVKGEHPVRIEDMVNHPVAVGFPPNHPPMRSFLGTPVVGRRGVLGNLYLTEKVGAGSFSAEDEHVLVLLARTAAAAIDNARLHEESARLLSEVQSLHRTRERFFAMVNHELRNALAAVFGWAEMLVRSKKGETVPRAAYEVLDSASAAKELINDLLDLSRLDEDRLKPVLREVQCGGMIQHAVSRVHPDIEANGLRLTLDIDDRLTNCLTDASRVEQILVNLLRNAIRHSPPSGQIHVVAVPSGDRVQIQVNDDGPGIREAELERIFDVYETTAGDERRGVGLGLPLSRRLARLLGGELSATHEPGGGGRLLLELPHTTI